MKCLYCSEEHDRKGKYCSDSCKQKAYRRNATVTDNNRNVTVSPTVTQRGIDIQCFVNLPINVQRTVHRLSDIPEELFRRTAIAINYQHLFPDRYYNTGVALSHHKYKDKAYAKEASIYNEGEVPKLAESIK
ncbi:MAG: hypothetical protein ACYTBV_21250 [Planctomycetota bacterium]|jgi:hypothetical protein